MQRLRQRGQGVARLSRGGVAEAKSFFEPARAGEALTSIDRLTDGQLAAMSPTARARLAEHLSRPTRSDRSSTEASERNRAFARVVLAGVPANALPGQTAGAIDAVLCRLSPRATRAHHVDAGRAEVEARWASDPPGAGDWPAFQRYVQALARGTPSNGKVYRDTRVEVLVDGKEVFPSELADIAATNPGDMILGTRFAFHSDRRGQEYADALASAAGRGVFVAYAYDEYGSAKSTDPATGAEGATRWEMFDEIEAAGKRAGPGAQMIRLKTGFLAHQLNHRKAMLVIKRHEDGSVREAVGYILGLNIGDIYQDEWHDCGVRITGPGVQGVALELLAQLKADGAVIPPELEQLARREVPKAPDSNAEVVFNFHQGRQDQIIKYAKLRAYQTAQECVDGSFPYHLDQQLNEGEIDAAQRGVKVRAYNPANIDQKLVKKGMRGRAQALEGTDVAHLSYYGQPPDGIDPEDFEGQMSHGKVEQFDLVVSDIGTSNDEWRSLWNNDEGNVWVFSAPVAGELKERYFDPDEELSRPMVVPALGRVDDLVHRLLWKARKAF